MFSGMLNGCVVLPVEEYDRLKKESLSEVIKLNFRPSDAGVEVDFNNDVVKKVAKRMFDEQIKEADKERYYISDSFYIFGSTLAFMKREDEDDA